MPAFMSQPVNDFRGFGDSNMITCFRQLNVGMRLWCGCFCMKGRTFEAMTGFDGVTALHAVAEKEHEAVVRLLLKKGADFEAKNRDEKTALCTAAWWGHEAAVRRLLENGANKGHDN